MLYFFMQLDLDLTEEKCEHVNVILVLFLSRLILEKCIKMLKMQTKVCCA